MADAHEFGGRIGRGIDRLAMAAGRVGLADPVRLRKAINLALPRMLTGFARQSQRTVDLIMVGIAIGPAGIAGLALAAPFWSVASGTGSGISNGAIGLISQRFGAERYREVDVAIKQAIWISLLVGIPFTAGYWIYAEDLIRLVGAGPDTLEYGTTYLRIISLAIVTTYINKVGIRTLVGTGDAWVEMVIRGTAAVINVVLNAVFLFGLGMGVFGVALATVLAKVFVLVTFSIGFYRGRFPVIGAFPVRVSAYPYVDGTLIRQTTKIALPLILRRGARRVGRFPLIAIVATFGTPVVAAYGIARRAYALMRTPDWGFGLAASSLVGQELGANNETEAEAYGWDIARFAVVFYVALAVAVVVFARPIVLAFTGDPTVIVRAVPFVRILGIGTVLYGVDGISTGILRAGGDTTWPMYGRFVGLYLFTLPIAYLAVATPLGILALYLALLTESLVPAGITLYRVSTGHWKEVSRQYRPSPA